MIAYTHLMEFLPDRESLVSGVFMCLDGLIYFFSPLFFQYISSNLDLMFLLAFLFNMIGVSCFLAIKVPESLKFLLTSEKIEKFWSEYEKI